MDPNSNQSEQQQPQVRIEKPRKSKLSALLAVLLAVVLISAGLLAFMLFNFMQIADDQSTRLDSQDEKIAQYESLCPEMQCDPAGPPQGDFMNEGAVGGLAVDTFNIAADSDETRGFKLQYIDEKFARVIVYEGDEKAGDELVTLHTLYAMKVEVPEGEDDYFEWVTIGIDPDEAAVTGLKETFDVPDAVFTETQVPDAI